MSIIARVKELSKQSFKPVRKSISLVPLSSSRTATQPLAQPSSPTNIVYLIACGLIGEPVPPGMTSGAPQKKNS